MTAGNSGFADSVRSKPGLACAFLVDAVGTGMFLPFSLLFFLATTSLPLTRIGLALSVAALVRIPVTIAAGPLSDRFGPRAVVVVSQLLQAAGFAGYLLVHGFWVLVAAAALVQTGNSLFWVAYAPLIFAVARRGERERWFALGTALRAGGWAAGGAIAGAAVAFAGRGGYMAVAAADSASFVLAACLTARVRPGARDLRAVPVPGRGGWRPLLRDRPFLGFVAVNSGITFLAIAVPTALPVFLVKILSLPSWSPGAALALNAVMAALSAPVVMTVISGRRRRNVLMASQAVAMSALAVFLLVHLLAAGPAAALVLAAALPLALSEVMQGAVIPAVVTESAPPALVGRYASAYEMTFGIADIACPAVVAAALRADAAVLWLPLAAVALLDIAAVSLLAQRMPALAGRVGAGTAGTGKPGLPRTGLAAGRAIPPSRGEGCSAPLPRPHGGTHSAPAAGCPGAGGGPEQAAGSDGHALPACR